MSAMSQAAVKFVVFNWSQLKQQTWIQIVKINTRIAQARNPVH